MDVFQSQRNGFVFPRLLEQSGAGHASIAAGCELAFILETPSEEVWEEGWLSRTVLQLSERLWGGGWTGAMFFACCRVGMRDLIVFKVS